MTPIHYLDIGRVIATSRSLKVYPNSNTIRAENSYY